MTHCSSGDIMIGVLIFGARLLLQHWLNRKHICMFVTEGGINVSEVRVKENETLDSALRRFKRQCAKSGVLAEVRKREHYVKPSVKRKKKSEAARKRKTK